MANAVLIIASHPERRSHLEQCLGSLEASSCIAITTVEELPAVVSTVAPGLRAVIVDHEEPFVERLQLLSDMRTLLPETPIVISGAPAHGNPHRVQIILRYFEYGAAGYVCLDEPCERLAHALDEATRGESYVDPPVALELLDRLVDLHKRLKHADPYVFDNEPEELTPRQLEVLRLVSAGCTNQEIAELLDISVGTVKNHVHAILEALKVSSRAEATKAFREMKALESQATDAPTGRQQKIMTS